MWSPTLLSLVAACLLALVSVPGAQAVVNSRGKGIQGERPPSTASSNAMAPRGAGGSVSLADVVSSPAIKRGLEADAIDQQRLSQALARLVTTGAYVAGLGFGIGAVVKFKQHKDNPTQIVFGRPVAVSFTGAGITFIDAATAMTGALVFKQAGEGEAVAASEQQQANADPPESAFSRVPSPAARAPDPSLTRLLALTNRELRGEARLAGVSHAEVMAVARGLAAAKAGDHLAYEKQKAAVARYLGEEAALLTQLAALRPSVAAAFSALEVGLRVTHRGMANLARYVSAHGLGGVRRGLEQLGVNPASVGLANVSAAQFASQLSASGSQFDLSRLFAAPARQDAAERHLAGLLRAAGHALK